MGNYQFELEVKLANHLPDRQYRAKLFWLYQLKRALQNYLISDDVYGSTSPRRRTNEARNI